jgi:hypothetical protein
MPDKVLVDIIEQHLPYEIDMLRSTYGQLSVAAKIDPASETFEQRLIRFSLIESFCAPARALLDFFSNRRNYSTDAVASDFTDGFTPTFDANTEDFKTLSKQLNKQLFHLTKERTLLDQFDAGNDGTKILRYYIEPAIEHFRSCLANDFQHFKCNTSPVTFESTIRTPPFASATGTLTTVSLTVNFPNASKRDV